MVAKILYGKPIADQIRAEVAREVAEIAARGERPPHLTAVLVGENPASQVYVRNKTRTAGDLGISSTTLKLDVSTGTDRLLEEVRRLNEDPNVDGILVQLPLPSAVDADRVLESIDVGKDVDGFHPVNLGRLLLGSDGCLPPCTPAGIIEMLVRSGIRIAGARACVLGRSRIVGKPIAAMLLNRHATVTVCHSQTRQIQAAAREGDILIAATGRAGMVTGDMIRPGAVVIDVGINEIRTQADAERFFEGAELDRRMAEIATRGRTLVGDVLWRQALPVAGWITPVPGGVGPLTIAMLMKNVVAARKVR